MEAKKSGRNSGLSRLIAPGLAIITCGIATYLNYIYFANITWQTDWNRDTPDSKMLSSCLFPIPPFTLFFVWVVLYLFYKTLEKSRLNPLMLFGTRFVSLLSVILLIISAWVALGAGGNINLALIVSGLDLAAGSMLFGLSLVLINYGTTYNPETKKEFPLLHNKRVGTFIIIVLFTCSVTYPVYHIAVDTSSGPLLKIYLVDADISTWGGNTHGTLKVTVLNYRGGSAEGNISLVLMVPEDSTTCLLATTEQIPGYGNWTTNCLFTLNGTYAEGEWVGTLYLVYNSKHVDAWNISVPYPYQGEECIIMYPVIILGCAAYIVRKARRRRA